MTQIKLIIIEDTPTGSPSTEFRREINLNDSEQLQDLSLKLMVEGANKIKKDNLDLSNKSENEIKKTLRRALESIRRKSNEYCFFIINLEPQNENDLVLGFNDIKFNVSGWDKYFCFECKLLGKEGKTHLFFKEGLSRFCNGKYCLSMDEKGNIEEGGIIKFGGMVGFITEGDSNLVLKDIKDRLKNLEYTKKYHIELTSDFKLLDKTLHYTKYSFCSKHKREIVISKDKKRISDILIYHLLFDFVS